MDEYIKREDILKILHAARYNCAYNREDLMSNGTLDVYKWLKTKIEKLSAADVVPRELYQRALSDVVTLSAERKRGKWERKLVPVCDEGIIMIPGNVCSECGGITTYNVSLFKYCPRCGAQMESGDE